MSNFSTNSLKVLLTIGISFLFGQACLPFLPLICESPIFLVSVLLFFVFLIVLIIDMKVALVILFIARASLDPILNSSRVDAMGGMGLGAVLNFIVIAIAISLMIGDPKRISGNPVNKWWFLYLAMSGVSIVFSPDLAASFKVFGQLLSYASIFLIPCYLVRSLKDKKFWILVLFFSSFLHIFLANVDLLIGRQVYPDEGWRIKGAFSHPNVLAFYLVFLIMLTFYIFKSDLFLLTRAKIRWMRIFLIDLFVLLIATKTRSAWISLVTFFFIYGVIKERKYLVMSLVLPLLFVLMPLTRERIMTAFGTGSGGNNSFLWRIQVWLSSLPSIQEGFLFGKGLGSFERLSVEFDPFMTWKATSKAAHNTYLEVLFEAGIVALVGFVGIFLSILRVCYGKAKSVVGALSAEYSIVFAYVASYMIVCFSDNMRHYLAINWYFWFFFGIMITARGLSHERT